MMAGHPQKSKMRRPARLGYEQRENTEVSRATEAGRTNPSTWHICNRRWPGTVLTPARTAFPLTIHAPPQRAVTSARRIDIHHVHMGCVDSN